MPGIGTVSRRFGTLLPGIGPDRDPIGEGITSSRTPAMNSGGCVTLAAWKDAVAFQLRSKLRYRLSGPLGAATDDSQRDAIGCDVPVSPTFDHMSLCSTSPVRTAVAPGTCPQAPVQAAPGHAND